MGNAADVADHKEVSAMISLLENSINKMEHERLRVAELIRLRGARIRMAGMK